MADKKLLNAEEAVAEEEVVFDAAVEELELLRAAIADLEEKEAILTEKLCLAKEKGLTAQADKCRELLQKVIAQKQVKKGELQEAEARKLAAELDELTEQMENEISPKPFEEEKELEYNYRAKANRMGLISRLIGFVGVFACMVGAIVYLLLTQVETMNLPFEWLYLAITGGAAVVFLIVAICIGNTASAYRCLADEIEAERVAAEEALAEQAKAELLALHTLNAAIEANGAEVKQDMQNAKPKRTFLPDVKLPEVPEKIKKNVHKIVPVAAICTAIVAATAIKSAQKNAAAAKRSAAARKEFFNWLG